MCPSHGLVEALVDQKLAVRAMSAVSAVIAMRAVRAVSAVSAVMAVSAVIAMRAVMVVGRLLSSQSLWPALVALRTCVGA